MPNDWDFAMDKEQINQIYEAAVWWEGIKKRTVPTFLELMADRHKHLVLKGSAGSGKSIFAGQKIIERCVLEPGHRMLVTRKIGKELRQSCFIQLCTQADQLHPEMVDRIPKGPNCDMYIRFVNGSEIIFSGLDDVGKLKSIYNITGMWIEEANEITEADFNQLDIRLRGASPWYKQIILTFNPVSVTSWLKARFFDRPQDDRIRTHESSYLDNPYLGEDDRKTLEAFKETDPYYYQVYCLNQWGVLGDTIFDKAAIGRQLEKKTQPVTVGEFGYSYDGLRIGSWEFAENESGNIKVYERPMPGHPYVIGGDTAGDGSDWFVGQVVDNSNGRQVAVYRVRTDEDLFARQMYCLGMWYNTALIGIESNFSTHPLRELERLGYPNLYMREQEDRIGGGVMMALGFKTTSLTRPIIIAELKAIFRDHPEMIVDQTTLEEMLSFGRNAKGRPEAAQGTHDDTVMALAITYYIRTQQRATVQLGTGAKVRWEQDMLDDYWAAGPAEQADMIKRWGNPF